MLFNWRSSLSRSIHFERITIIVLISRRYHYIGRFYVEFTQPKIVCQHSQKPQLHMNLKKWKSFCENLYRMAKLAHHIFQALSSISMELEFLVYDILISCEVNTPIQIMHDKYFFKLKILSCSHFNFHTFTKQKYFFRITMRRMSVQLDEKIFE